MKKFLLNTGITLVAIFIIFLMLGVVIPTQQYSFSITINAPVEKTFAVFSDTTRMKEWMPGYKKIENISGNANQPGSKWRLFFFDHDKNIVLEETMTDFKLNELFSFNLVNEVINSNTEIRFTPKGTSTEITNSCTYSGGNIFWKSLFVFANKSITSQQKGSFELLKGIVEKGN